MTPSPPIEFTDEEGLRWTVEHRALPAGGDPHKVVLDLICESGEHRVAEVFPLDDENWSGVNENAWRFLLRRARVVRWGRRPEG